MKIKFFVLSVILGFCCNLFICKASKFEIGENTFLLDGKPFVVKAAELHYPRIPRDYWEHRIEMCKSLGMNAICLYVFWNYHEQTPGVFDFSEDKDIASFCKLAQKHGMYVIVRPGPYVCAEWEMGGLPWWLLKNDSIQLRSMDPDFMRYVRRYIKRVGEELADLQITKGGNIIMVQVENEFGSYGIDKKYVSAIRDVVRESFSDVPLFQCDWSSNFLNNGLDDLLWTVNFGTGADIDAQFAKLKEVRPKTPLMCSEFWSGWFDHWGRKHETRDGSIMVENLKEMLEKGISFSLYMTHGGTTFGHWGGANNPAYSAMCTSYDYDAPISEAGWTTEKYFQLRNMLSNFSETPLPEIPVQYPVMSVPTFKFEYVAPLFANLPDGHEVEKIMPMEKFDQGWGTILYRTILPKVKAGTVLRITEQHDWTQVYVNGVLLTSLDRREGEQEVVLPDIAEGAVLDLLVEAMGRVNFDKSIHDRKGITEKVELLNGNSVLEIKGWTVYNFPLDYDFVLAKNYQKQAVVDGPAYYKATFTVDSIADTFLDMESWGKGMVWLNGHELGRFWNIGPQQTLYVPGCWLKKGINEVVVLDMMGPSKAEMKGVVKPKLDVLKVDAPVTHRKEGETLDLSGEKCDFIGLANGNRDWQHFMFKETLEGRYICLEALESFDGENLLTIAELKLMDAEGKEIPRENWKVLYADSEETRSGNHTADKVFDLQETTYWQTIDNQSYPHHLVIDLGAEYTIGGISFIPCVNVGKKGLCKRFKLYINKVDFVYE